MCIESFHLSMIVSVFVMVVGVCVVLCVAFGMSYMTLFVIALLVYGGSILQASSLSATTSFEYGHDVELPCFISHWKFAFLTLSCDDCDLYLVNCLCCPLHISCLWTSHFWSAVHMSSGVILSKTFPLPL